MKIKDKLAFFEKNDDIISIKKELLRRNGGWIKQKREWMDFNDSMDTIILTCMDSRVPVEKIFDLNPGEVLVLRNAGNIITDDVFRSVLAGIFAIHVKNIIILGHSRCGMAVKDNDDKMNHLNDSIPEKMKNKIGLGSKKDMIDWFGFFEGGKWNENAKDNAIFLDNKLKEVLNPDEMPEVVAAVYDLDSGKVEFL